VRINWDDPESLHGLIAQLDFYCEPNLMISLFGVAFLLGIVIGSVTLARLADVYGRKKIFMIGLLMEISCAIGFLLCRNWILADILLLFFGASLSAGRYVGYSYLIELMPTDK
jgi:MFS family permease